MRFQLLKRIGVVGALLRTFAPKIRLSLNLPRRKVMIYFCQKGKKMGGHRLRFGENMPRKIPKSEKHMPKYEVPFFDKSLIKVPYKDVPQVCSQ